MTERGASLEVAEVCERIFAKELTTEGRIEAESGAWPAELWALVEAAGLLRPHLGAAAGGLGGGWALAHPVLVAIGRHALPLPLAETMVAGKLLEGAGFDLPPGIGSFAPHAIDASRFSGGCLNASLDRVPWGRFADWVVWTDDVGVGLVSRDRCTAVDKAENLAREARDTLHFESAPAERRDGRLPADSAKLLGALVRSASMAGALEALLRASLRYAGEREQFGRPIGKFQAVQQSLALLCGEQAAAGAAAVAACRAATTGDDARFEIAVAKIRCGDAVEAATSIAHQTHGAIGFSYEHGLHFWTRRLWSWRAEMGTSEFWAEAVGREILERGADAFWPDLAAR